MEPEQTENTMPQPPADAACPSCGRPRVVEARAFHATGLSSGIALALGALSVGVLAFGAIAIARLAIGRVVVGRARIGRLEIDDLVVRRVVEGRPARRTE